MDAAGVGIKAIRGATLSKSGVVTFRVTVNGGVITHKGALQFSSSAGFVTLQNIVLNYTTGKATAFVEVSAVPTGIQITDVLTFTGGNNQIKQNGTWRQRNTFIARPNVTVVRWAAGASSVGDGSVGDAQARTYFFENVWSCRQPLSCGALISLTRARMTRPSDSGTQTNPDLDVRERLLEIGDSTSSPV